MRMLYVPLEADVLERLLRLAAQERRTPKLQAAYLIERGLPEAAKPPFGEKATLRIGCS